MTSPINTAFILGAGRGERLKPWTDKYPKPLLPVNGRPMITYAMDHLLTVGVERFIVNTHHHGERYAEAFPRGEWHGHPIIFWYEPVILNTGGGLKNIEGLVAGEETIWVYNGDIISDLPLHTLVEFHWREGCEVSIALRTYGKNRNVGVDRGGRICDFRFTLGREVAGLFQFTGIYLVERRFFRRIPSGQPIDIIDVFLAMVRERPGAVGGIVIDDGTWNDVGDPETYARLNGWGDGRTGG